MCKRRLNSNPGKMVLCDTCLQSTPSAGFLNIVSIPCPNNSSVDLFICRVAGSLNLNLVTLSGMISLWHAVLLDSMGKT